jgi:FKBP-type peptidyl-prolyl cis-trans isomerase FklB
MKFAYIFQKSLTGIADQLAQLRAEVTELESRLQYKILLTGAGEKSKAHNEVTCHYHNILIDDSIIGNSVQRDKPAVFH